MDKTFYHEALNSLTERFIYLSAPCTIFLAAPTAYSQAMGTGRLPEEKAFVVQPRGSSGEAPVPGAGEAGWGAPSCLGMPVLPETGQGSAEEPWNPPASHHPGTGGAHGLHQAAGWHLGRCQGQQGVWDTVGRGSRLCSSQLGTPVLWCVLELVLLTVPRGRVLC